MGSQYQLGRLNDSELVAGLKDLVRRGNELTAELLAHLAELEARLVHLELGFPSVFAYCIQVLGLSEAAAGRRLTGARVCRRFPEVFALVASGDLHLSALCALAPHLTVENARELFNDSRRKTRRQIEALLAARFPKPDIREQIRRLPVRGEPSPGVEASPSQMQAIPARAEVPPARVKATEAVPAPPARVDVSLLVEVPTRIESSEERRMSPESRGCSAHLQFGAVPGAAAGAARGAEGGGAGARPIARTGTAPRARELEALSTSRFGVHFTADLELRELIERARELASHRVPNGELAAIMKLALTLFVKHEEKRRFAVGTRSIRQGRDPGTRSRRAEQFEAHAVGSASRARGTAGGRSPGPHPPQEDVRTHVAEGAGRFCRFELTGDVWSAPPGGMLTHGARDDDELSSAPLAGVSAQKAARAGGESPAPTAQTKRKGVGAAERSLVSPSKVSARDGDHESETSPFSRDEALAHDEGRTSSKRSRHIPAAVRREVYERDRGRCAFVSADGRRCEASAFLEYDHELPWAVHGASASSNVRLLCRAHNALHAQNCFGRKCVAEKIAARRRGPVSEVEVRRGRL